MLCDLPSTHEHHPGIADQLGAHEHDREQRDDGDRAHDQPVRLQGGQGARAAIEWKGGDDRGFDTSAIGTTPDAILPRMGRPARCSRTDLTWPISPGMESLQLPEGQRSSLPSPGGSARLRLHHGRPLTSPAIRRRLGTISAGVLAVVLAILAFKVFTLWDFRVFWEAGNRLLAGARLYPSDVALGADTRDYFVYPPVVAFAFVPLALIPFAIAEVLYTIASITAIFASLRLVGVRDWRCYAVLPFWMPVLQAVGLGTIAPFLAVALAVAWRYRDRRLVGTAALGLAIASKLFLWPIVFWFVATRRYRRALETIGVTAAAIVIMIPRMS